MNIPKPRTTGQGRHLKIIRCRNIQFEFNNKGKLINYPSLYNIIHRRSVRFDSGIPKSKTQSTEFDDSPSPSISIISQDDNINDNDDLQNDPSKSMKSCSLTEINADEFFLQINIDSLCSASSVDGGEELAKEIIL